MKRLVISGFSLLELLIVLAVAGILASVAYPAYKDSMQKGRRAQARVAIAEVLQQQERFMTQYNCYMAFTTGADGTTAAIESPDCGITVSTPVPFKPFSGDNLAASSHLISAGPCAGSGAAPSLRECVRVEARPVRGDPGVEALWMASTGARGCTGPALADAATSSCWP